MGEGLRSLAELKTALQMEQATRASQLEDAQQRMMTELNQQTHQMRQYFLTELQTKENLLARQILETKENSADQITNQIATLRKYIMQQFDNLVKQGTTVVQRPIIIEEAVSNQPRPPDNSPIQANHGILGASPSITHAQVDTAMVLDALSSPRRRSQNSFSSPSARKPRDELGSWSTLFERHRYLLTMLVLLAFLCTVYLYFAVTLGVTDLCSGLSGSEKALCLAKLMAKKGKLKFM